MKVTHATHRVAGCFFGNGLKPKKQKNGPTPFLPRMTFAIPTRKRMAHVIFWKDFVGPLSSGFVSGCCLPLIIRSGYFIIPFCSVTYGVAAGGGATAFAFFAAS